jgi:hypothetical protein
MLLKEEEEKTYEKLGIFLKVWEVCRVLLDSAYQPTPFKTF